MSDDTLQVRKLSLHPGAVVGVCVVTTVAGAALGWGADALFGWFQQTFDGAPALLRAAAALPQAITIAALAAAGLIFGIMMLGDWESETLVCEIRADGVQTRLHKRTAWIARERIGSIYADGEELVIADETGRILGVGKVDGVGRQRAMRAFDEAGYPWSDGGHPLEQDFRPFVDGRDDLGEPATALIRARATALEDGQKARARELRAELSDAGVLVRDRRGDQEFAQIPSAGSASAA